MPARMRRWRRGCGRGRSRSSSVRTGCSRPARRSAERSRRATPHSMILHGPPGERARRPWRGSWPSAPTPRSKRRAPVQAGRAEVRAVIERARQRLSSNGKRTILFLDEIHRFNKAQQDALLPAVEEGLVTLIGATTENPYFEVNSALLSRARVYELEPLTADQVRRAARQGGRPRRVRAGGAGGAGGARVPGRALRRRRPDRVERARAGVRDRRARGPGAGSPRPRTLYSSGRSSTTARPTATTTRSRPGSRRPAGRTRTRRSTTSR